MNRDGSFFKINESVVGQEKPLKVLKDALLAYQIFYSLKTSDLDAKFRLKKIREKKKQRERKRASAEDP